jgi:putative DNA primase/helicase
MTTLEDAINQMVEFGLDVDVPIIDGKVHKSRYMGEKRKSGWYVIHNYRKLFSGRYGSWKVDEQGRKIIKRVSIDIDKKELEQARKLASQKAELELENKRKAFKEAQARSLEIWKSCLIDGSSPYLDRKQISPCGARFYGSTLVIPMAKEGKLRSLQSIKYDGFKKFMKGGEVSGCYFLIEGKGRLALVEGFATGASVHMATGWNVAVCFSASNLPKAAPYFRKKDCVICADNDEAGLRYGEIAQKELSCLLKYPSEGVDFNDLHVLKGLEEVNKCLI